MSEVRVVKNKSRIGKPWLVVRGRIVQGALAYAKGEPGRWKTEQQLGEYQTRSAAEAALLATEQVKP